MKLYGHSFYQEIKTFPREGKSSASAPSPRFLDKSSWDRAKAATQLQLDGTSEEDDPGEPKDSRKKSLLGKVFGNSPIPMMPKQNPFKSSSKKSVRKKTSRSHPVDPDQGSSASDDDHDPPPLKKSTSTKKKLFAVFKDSPKKEKPKKSFKFQFNRDHGLPGFREVEELEEKKTPRKTSLQPSSPHKGYIKDKNYKNFEHQQPSFDDEIQLLLESSKSGSVIPEAPEAEEQEVVELSSDTEVETPADFGECQVESEETTSNDGDLFDSLKNRFSLSIGRKKDKPRVGREICGSRKIFQQTERFRQPSSSFHSEVDLDQEEEEEDRHLFNSPARKGKTPRKGRNQESPVARRKPRSPASPSIDDLLQLPEKVGTTGKTMDEILDEGNSSKSFVIKLLYWMFLF